jgi:hypothetical protein
MNNQKLNLKMIARIAGLLYLINAITGAFGIIVIPAKLIVPDNVAATVHNIISNEFLFRCGILSSFVSQIIFVFLALTLYKLFEKVSIFLTRTLLALVVTSVPIAFFIIFYQMSAFSMLKESFMTSFEQVQQYSLAMSKLKMYENGIVVIGIFWGLWLIPFGQLVYKSNFIPKVFGILLIAGGISYLIDVITFILIPEFHAQTNILVAIISTIAELSMVLWFLIKGIRSDKETVVTNN